MRGAFPALRLRVRDSSTRGIPHLLSRGPGHGPSRGQLGAAPLQAGLGFPWLFPKRGLHRPLLPVSLVGPLVWIPDVSSGRQNPGSCTAACWEDRSSSPAARPSRAIPESTPSGATAEPRRWSEQVQKRLCPHWFLVPVTRTGLARFCFCPRTCWPESPHSISRAEAEHWKPSVPRNLLQHRLPAPHQ